MEARASKGAGEAGSREAPIIKNGPRREYKEWFKAQVVEECQKPGASVSIVARRHDINANVLFRWRREYRLGIIRPSQRSNGSANFIPAGIIGGDGKFVAQASAKPAISASTPAKAKTSAVKALPAPVPVAVPAKPRPGVVELHLSGHVTWTSALRFWRLSTQCSTAGRRRSQQTQRNPHSN